MISIKKIKVLYEALTVRERAAFASVSVVLFIMLYRFTLWISKGRGTETTYGSNVTVEVSQARILSSLRFESGNYSVIELVICFVVFLGLWIGLTLIIFRGGKRKK